MAQLSPSLLDFTLKTFILGKYGTGPIINWLNFRLKTCIFMLKKTVFLQIWDWFDNSSEINNNKLGLYWAKLRSNWNWALVHWRFVVLINKVYWLLWLHCHQPQPPLSMSYQFQFQFEFQACNILAQVGCRWGWDGWVSLTAMIRLISVLNWICTELAT